MTLKKRLCKCLTMLKEEIDKRENLFKYGVDLINYENLYTEAVLDIITFNIYLINKKYEKSEKEIREYLEWWLYEDVEKKIWIDKRIYKVDNPQKFLNFLLRH